MKKPSEADDIEPRDPRAYPRSPQRDPRAARPVYIVETEEIGADRVKPADRDEKTGKA